MKKIAFLTCDDLTGFVFDDDLAVEAFRKHSPQDSLEVISWSDPDVKWEDFDYAVIRTTWDYTKKRNQFIQKLKEIESRGCKLLNSSDVVNWNSEKTYLHQLDAKGVSIIPSVFLGKETQQEALDKIQRLKSDKLVIKPVIGASAEQIQIFSKDEMKTQVEKIENPEAWFVQPFVEEVLDGELSFIFFNDKLSHVIKKVPKKGDFRVQEEHGGEITLYHPNEGEVSFAKGVLDKIEEDLFYARVDVLKTKQGLQVIELELIEPSLYFRIDPPSADRFVKALSELV